MLSVWPSARPTSPRHTQNTKQRTLTPMMLLWLHIASAVLARRLDDRPGGSLSACISRCPSDPAGAYKSCVDACVAQCSTSSQSPPPSPPRSPAQPELFSVPFNFSSSTGVAFETFMGHGSADVTGGGESLNSTTMCEGMRSMTSGAHVGGDEVHEAFELLGRRSRGRQTCQTWGVDATPLSTSLPCPTAVPPRAPATATTRWARRRAWSSTARGEQ